MIATIPLAPCSQNRYKAGMEPASRIIEALGGPGKVAQIVGIHRTRVSNWKRPRDAGGTGGAVPHWHVPKLLAAAREQGIPLSAADFVASQIEPSSHAPSAEGDTCS
jgi:hypothetical protein